MKEATCADCTYFCQHYIYFLEMRYDTIPCGHCIYPRLKHRKPNTLACVHFKRKEKINETAAEG